MFDLELDRIKQWVSDRGYSSVAIQLPEGLKIRAGEVSDALSEDGIDTVILGDPCYGACDLFSNYKRYADALIHFGHSPIPSLGDDPDVLYVEARASVNISGDVIAAAEPLPKKIGLLATVQYVHCIPEVKMLLESIGKEVSVGIGDNRICYPGQVLGCNCSTAESVEGEVDAFLFLGEGDFHPLAASFGVKKPMIIFNPITGESRTVDEIRDRILRKRFAVIENSRSAERFLVIVCEKAGQNRSEQADAVIEKIRIAGKKAYKIVINEINPDALIHYRVDAYVNTACPRIAMDDSARYRVPMLTVPELDIVLGLSQWDDYKFDSI